MYQRAAQFAPFAALTGHSAAIQETARLTDSMIEMDNELSAMLNKKFSILRNHLKEHPEVTITYFQPDERKAGGAYETHTGSIRTIDDYEQIIILTDDKKIPIHYVLDIKSKVFGG